MAKLPALAAAFALLLMVPAPASAMPPGHVGCMFHGWWALPPIPAPLTSVPKVMSYIGVPPPPMDQYGCIMAGITQPNWSSWSMPCTAAVPPGTSVNGAWCGGNVGLTGIITCTIAGTNGILIGVDENGDGYVNELDAAPTLAPPVSEVWGPVGSAYSPGWPPGARIIAFPIDFSVPAYGATTNANFAVFCF